MVPGGIVFGAGKFSLSDATVIHLEDGREYKEANYTKSVYFGKLII